MKSGYLALFLAIVLGLTGALEAAAVRPRVGAIRWDAWLGPLHHAGLAVEKSLGPNHWHDKLPFYAVEGDNMVQIRATTQAIIDAEIDLAKGAGIDYFAYVVYFDAMKTAFELHMKSARKSDVKYCFILVRPDAFVNWPAPLPFFAKHFQDGDYVKVGGRPLIFNFPGAATAVELRQIDSVSMAAGAGHPYVVDMGTGLGSLADARSRYASFVGSETGAPFTSLMDDCRNSWSAYAKTVPLVSAGWDPRPRLENPVSWTTYPNSWTQKGTPTQIANLLQDAVRYVAQHPVRCEANAVLVYAWNEFDEGGWICPNLEKYGGAQRLEAIKKITREFDAVGVAGPRRASGPRSYGMSRSAGRIRLRVPAKEGPEDPGIILDAAGRVGPWGPLLRLFRTPSIPFRSRRFCRRRFSGVRASPGPRSWSPGRLRRPCWVDRP